MFVCVCNFKPVFTVLEHYGKNYTVLQKLHETPEVQVRVVCLFVCFFNFDVTFAESAIWIFTAMSLKQTKSY